jgi:eukaryotic-like serine/threonine-protein kinase
VPGEVIADRYELEELVGTGGMSSVYRARDRLLERRVALKVLHRHYADDEEYVERFRREARSVAQLSHPHIVTVIDRGEDGGQQFIVFEYVDGENLKQLVERTGPLPTRRAVELALAIAGALAFAHEHGLVHRDVKPQNVLLTPDGDAKVTDFGIARSLDVEHGMTQTGTVLGTSNYLSPEQAGGKTTTATTDVYSLGVVLYELLTGRKPFVADSLNMLIEKILHQDPPMPSTLRNGVPRSVDAIVLRAMGKKPEHRYKTWAEFALELFDAVKLVLPAEAVADSEKYVALKRVEMLIGLSDAELWEMASAARWMRVLAKKVLVRENEEGHSFFFLARGQVKVTRQGRLLNMVDEREFFGEMAYLWGGKAPRSATIEAATDLLVAEFEPEAVARMSEGAQLHLMRALARNLADRLDLANTRLGR